MEWFRSWHGAPTDLKWPVIAKHVNLLAGENRHMLRTCVTCVTAFAWVLLDYASQHDNRGCITGFNFEGYALFADVPEDTLRLIVTAMHDKNVLKDNHFLNWSKRQSSDSAARMRTLRERRKNEHVTERASHVLREDKIRIDKILPIVPQSTAVTPPVAHEEFSGDFEELWRVWKPYDMIKGNKLPAIKSYSKIRKSGVKAQSILTGAISYCTECTRRQSKTQHVSTWLNQRGWESPPEPIRRSFYDDPMNRMPSPAGG